MSQSFARIAFIPLVKEEQTRRGSRRQYERVEQIDEFGDRLTPSERDFILSRDSFYMASTSETGWPYIQHRGGDTGFLHVLDERTLAFADYRGNRQYISLGNLKHDDRVALFLMDYPSRTRLKILGRVVIHEGEEAKELIERITDASERARVERVIVIKVEAFDWNCQQYITPRYTEEQVARVMAPIRERLANLERENKELRERLESVTA
jgi:predicted pyridoxine 5'-phosphate oxidase superfamily flavin-nucleotide-binding protein